MKPRTIGKTVLLWAAVLTAALVFTACAAFTDNGGSAGEAQTVNDPAKLPTGVGTEKTQENSAADMTEKTQENSAADITAEAPATTLPEDPGTSQAAEEPEPEPVVIVVDPGHGGIFSGAADFGAVEKDMTLKLSKYLKDYLESNYEGIRVVLTRDEDTELDSNIVTDLEDRAEVAKNAGAGILVSIHFNASEKHNAEGATVYASGRPETKDESAKLGEAILERLSMLGLKNNGVLTTRSNDMFDENGEAYDYYAINRHCNARNIVGIIVEHCFMDNESDFSFCSTDEALEKLAQADGNGIADYLGLNRR